MTISTYLPGLFALRIPVLPTCFWCFYFVICTCQYLLLFCCFDCYFVGCVKIYVDTCICLHFCLQFQYFTGTCIHYEGCFFLASEFETLELRGIRIHFFNSH